MSRRRQRRKSQPRRRRHPFLGWLERGLWLTGALALLWVFGARLDAFAYQLWQGHRLEELRRSPRPAGASPVGASPAELPGDEGAGGPAAPLREQRAPGEPEGRLVIPRLDVDVVVAHGAGESTLHRAVGHIPGTALPGSGGNVGLAGHRDHYFRPLEKIREGDEILFDAPERTFRYRVEWIGLVDPSDVWILNPTSGPALTLVTCYPFRYVGSAPRRFIVRARQVEPVPVSTAALRSR